MKNKIYNLAKAEKIYIADCLCRQKVSEDDHQILRSYTADQPLAPRGRDTEHYQSHDINEQPALPSATISDTKTQI